MNSYNIMWRGEKYIAEANVKGGKVSIGSVRKYGAQQFQTFVTTQPTSDSDNSHAFSALSDNELNELLGLVWEAHKRIYA